MKKDKLIDNVKMAGNLIIGVTAVPIIIKEKENNLKKKVQFWESFIFVSPYSLQKSSYNLNFLLSLNEVQFHK